MGEGGPKEVFLEEGVVLIGLEVLRVGSVVSVGSTASVVDWPHGGEGGDGGLGRHSPL